MGHTLARTAIPAAGMPSASNHFRYSDYPVVIAEKLPSEFRFEHLGSLHLLVVCFIGAWASRSLRLAPALG